MSDLPADVQKQVTSLQSFQKDLAATISMNDKHDPNAWFIGGLELMGWAEAALKSPTDAVHAMPETKEQHKIGLVHKDVKSFAEKLKELTVLRITALKEEASAGKTSMNRWLGSALHDAAMKRTTTLAEGEWRPATMGEINKWLGVTR